MSRTLRQSLLVVLIATGLAACGNKGPLVLPDQTPAPAAAKDQDKSKSGAAPQAQPSGDAAKKN
jgi:predicted small lipoprotein YifL